MHIASTYSGGFDVAITEHDLAEFSRKWPCFGVQTNPVMWRGGALLFTFDRRGDLVDIVGDEGLNEAGVAALAEDAKAYAVSVYELSNPRNVLHHHVTGAVMRGEAEPIINKEP